MVKVEIRKAEIIFCFLLSSFLFFHVASLLEVGTGFHPELTGRENIFLNGAILGMSRVEIRQKFDEMVALVSWLCLRSDEQPTDRGLAEFSGVV